MRGLSHAERDLDEIRSLASIRRETVHELDDDAIKHVYTVLRPYSRSFSAAVLRRIR